MAEQQAVKAQVAPEITIAFKFTPGQGVAVALPEGIDSVLAFGIIETGKAIILGLYQRANQVKKSPIVMPGTGGISA